MCKVHILCQHNFHVNAMAHVNAGTSAQCKFEIITFVTECNQCTL